MSTLEQFQHLQKDAGVELEWIEEVFTMKNTLPLDMKISSEGEIESLVSGGQGETVGCKVGAWVVEIRDSEGKNGVAIDSLDQLEEVMSQFANGNQDTFNLVTRREKTEEDKIAEELESMYASMNTPATPTVRKRPSFASANVVQRPPTATQNNIPALSPPNNTAVSAAMPGSSVPLSPPPTPSAVPTSPSGATGDGSQGPLAFVPKSIAFWRRKPSSDSNSAHTVPPPAGTQILDSGVVTVSQPPIKAPPKGTLLSVDVIEAKKLIKPSAKKEKKKIELESFLVEHGFTEFKEALMLYGAENIAELADDSLISEAELISEVGFSKIQARRLKLQVSQFLEEKSSPRSTLGGRSKSGRRDHSGSFSSVSTVASYKPSPRAVKGSSSSFKHSTTPKASSHRKINPVLSSASSHTSNSKTPSSTKSSTPKVKKASTPSGGGSSKGFLERQAEQEAKRKAKMEKSLAEKEASIKNQMRFKPSISSKGKASHSKATPRSKSAARNNPPPSSSSTSPSDHLETSHSRSRSSPAGGLRSTNSPKLVTSKSHSASHDSSNHSTPERLRSTSKSPLMNRRSVSEPNEGHKFHKKIASRNTSGEESPELKKKSRSMSNPPSRSKVAPISKKHVIGGGIHAKKKDDEGSSSKGIHRSKSGSSTPRSFSSKRSVSDTTHSSQLYQSAEKIKQKKEERKKELERLDRERELNTVGADGRTKREVLADQAARKEKRNGGGGVKKKSSMNENEISDKEREKAEGGKESLNNKVDSESKAKNKIFGKMDSTTEINFNLASVNKDSVREMLLDDKEAREIEKMKSLDETSDQGEAMTQEEGKNAFHELLEEKLNYKDSYVTYLDQAEELYIHDEIVHAKTLFEKALESANKVNEIETNAENDKQINILSGSLRILKSRIESCKQAIDAQQAAKEKALPSSSPSKQSSHVDSISSPSPVTSPASPPSPSPPPPPPLPAETPPMPPPQIGMPTPTTKLESEFDDENGMHEKFAQFAKAENEDVLGSEEAMKAKFAQFAQSSGDGELEHEQAKKKAQEEEAQRKAEEAQRKAEEAKKVEEAQRKAEEAQRKADAIKRAEEAQRKAEQSKRKAEEAQRKAEEAKKAEEAQRKVEEAQRKAEEAKKAEEAQRKAQEAKQAEEFKDDKKSNEEIGKAIEKDMEESRKLKAKLEQLESMSVSLEENIERRRSSTVVAQSSPFTPTSKKTTGNRSPNASGSARKQPKETAVDVEKLYNDKGTSI